MQKKRIAQYCCAALVAAGIGLNIQNALEDYGIGENSLSLIADPGSGSNSNSNSNSNNTGTPTSNWRAETVWYRSTTSSGIQISYSQPSWYMGSGWTSIVCCLVGADIDGCDFSKEEKKCETIVQRPAH